SGCTTRSTAWDCDRRPCAYGSIAPCEMRSNVGAITTSVSTKARPASTALGGTAEAPIAERTSDSTTTMRTNDVHVTSANGSSESTVKTASTCSGTNACERDDRSISDSTASKTAEFDDPDAEAVADGDDLAAADAGVVEVEVHRIAGGAIQLDDRTVAELEHLRYREPAGAQLGGQLQRDVHQGVDRRRLGTLA